MKTSQAVRLNIVASAILCAGMISQLQAAAPAAMKLEPIVRTVASEAVPTDVSLEPGGAQKESSSARLPALKLKVLLSRDGQELPASIKKHAQLPQDFVKPENRSIQVTLKAGGRDAVREIMADDFRAIEVERPSEIPMILTPVPFNQDAARSHRVPQFIASFAPADGDGLIAAVFDGGAIRTSHQEFKTSTGSRVSLKTAKPTHYHATHVAGTVCAQGVAPNTEAKGMAVKLKLVSYDWDNDLQNLGSLGPDICVTNHSYGPLAGWYRRPTDGLWFWWGDRSSSANEDSKFGKYDSDCAQLDEILFANKTLLTVVAAGNERQDGPATQPIQHYVMAIDPSTGSLFWKASTELHQKDGFDQGGLDTIGGLGLAKNALCIGAINDVVAPGSAIETTTFSSWGPADDGRIKPDVVANGFQLLSTDDSDDQAYITLSGTSMATPCTSGIACLLRQLFEAKHGRKPISAELKAIFIHTAKDAGLVGPDPVYGWGSIDALAAGRLIASTNGRVLDGKKVAKGTTESIAITASAGDPLRTTVVWTDPAGTPITGTLDDATPALQNDIDCVLVAPNGTKYYPYSLVRTSPLSPATKTGKNAVDNVEVIDAPFLAGQWKLEITAPAHLEGGDSQELAVAVTGFDP